jgi:hypothetical protein
MRLEELKKEKLVRVVHEQHEAIGWCVISENHLLNDRVWVPDWTLHRFTGLVPCCICGTPRVLQTGWQPHPSLGDKRWLCPACHEALPVFNPRDPEMFDD